MEAINEAASNLGSQARVNTALAQTKWRKFLDKSKVEEDKRPITARLLENQLNWMQSLDEETHVASIGSFEKFVFPIIRAVYPNLVAADLVSVQPMEAPTSLVFYRDTRFGTSKGAVKAGDSMFSARTGWNDNAGFNYTSEVVENEALGAANNATAQFGGAGAKFAWAPVRPGSVVISYHLHGAVTAATLTDDGAGGFVGAAGELTPPATINYATGEYEINYVAGHEPNTGTITVTYDFNSEGHLDIPQIDLVLTSTPVIARPRKLRARWSIEAAAQLKSVHGEEAEVELMTDMANEVRIEVDREIIADLLALANANNISGTIPETTFPKTAPANISTYLHRQAFIYSMIEASNKIFRATRRHGATWLLGGVNVVSIIQGQEGEQFVPVGGDYQGSGVQFVGTLKGQWKIYLDPYMDPDTALMGYKGVSFLDSGYVYAPWIPFYATPTIYLDDFVGRKGLFTSYAKKPINGLFFAKLRLT
jgi:hypothetical protein